MLICMKLEMERNIGTSLVETYKVFKNLIGL